MKNRVLKQFNLKRNVIEVLIVVMLVLCIGLFMKNKMNTLNNTSINKESIAEELDENLIGAYIQQGEEYVKADTIPTSGYEFNADESYCKIGDVVQENITLSYDMETQTLTVSPIAKEGTKCYLYFDEQVSASDIILASPNAPTGQTTDWTGGITYYYTGNPNNWVQFGGFWWRIIRINGDGSIRMIYQGTSANETGTGTHIGTSAFNSSYSSNKTYVGLVYDESTQHGSGQPSTMMSTLNNWYNSNLASFEENYIDTGTGFCSDRNMASGSNFNSGDILYYAPYDRRNGPASLQCNSEDILSKDNGKLTNSIGLVTSDEAVLTGITSSTANTVSYLYTGQTYWTMSPNGFSSGNSRAFVFYVASDGYLDFTYYVTYSYGVRPVINLRSDVSLTGSGTISDPFKVVGAS